MEQFIIPDYDKWTPACGSPVGKLPWAVPAYQEGDWITVNYPPISNTFAPKVSFGTVLVWKAESTPTEDITCGCGYSHRDVGADHFRRATDDELNQEIQRLIVHKFKMICELDQTMNRLRDHFLSQSQLAYVRSRGL